MYLVLRTVGDPLRLAPLLRPTVDALDPDVPLAEVQTMEQALGSWAGERRFTLFLVSGFAVLALTLGAVGIYGVMAHLAVERAREIGIRLALGAVPREILRLVLAQAAWMAGLGITLGVVGALALSRLLTKLLFGIHPGDPATLLLAALLLAGVALGATLLPALRAARVDPMQTLRSE